MVLVVALAIELLVSLSIGLLFFVYQEIVSVTWPRNSCLYIGIWGVRAVLVSCILIGVIRRSVKHCRLTWLGHLPLVLMTTFTVAPLIQIECACNDYWNCHAISGFTKLGNNFVNPFIAPQEQLAQESNNFAIKNPPSSHEKALIQLHASGTFQIDGPRKTRLLRWKVTRRLVKSRDPVLHGRHCEKLPQKYEKLAVKDILKEFDKIPTSNYLSGKINISETLDKKVVELRDRCNQQVKRLCRMMDFTLSVKSAEDNYSNRTLCLEWGSAVTRSDVPQNSETANSISVYFSRASNHTLRSTFQVRKESQEASLSMLPDLFVDEYKNECRCDAVLNLYQSCNVYYGASNTERFWCYIDPATHASCVSKNYKLKLDSKGQPWTEDLCRQIHADGDGCDCAGFGVKPSSVMMQHPVKTAMEEDPKDEWLFGSYCDVWAENQKQFCFVGFDSTCSDRHLVKFAVGDTQGRVYYSTLPCVKNKLLQTELLRDARGHCKALTWSILCSILCFNGLCMWISLAVFKFIANRCGDDFKESAQQFEAESDDDDTWAVTTG